jgi:hypothetical protein
LKKKDVYGKDDDIKYDWYFYLRVSIIILVFFNFALYIYDITNDPSINPKKTGGAGNSIFGSIKNMYYKLRDKETYFNNKLKDIQAIKQQIFNNNNRLTVSITEQQTHYKAYINANANSSKRKNFNDIDILRKNLNDSNEKLTRISNEIAKFKNKKLSDTEIRSLFDSDLNIAITNAKKFVPNFNTLPLQVQHAIVNMTFNLGINRLMKFKDLRQSLASRDFNKASKDMLNSKWASQVKGRAVELSNMVRSVAKKPVSVSSGE